MNIFKSYDEYDAWTEQFENCSDYEGIPTAIDDGWKIATDMFTACKSYKTALRRFKKQFSAINPEIEGWVDCMRECCESGYFQDTTGWRPAWTSDPAAVREAAQGGTYSWGVEETMEGYWYVFLNISGIYAGRERA